MEGNLNMTTIIIEPYNEWTNEFVKIVNIYTQIKDCALDIVHIGTQVPRSAANH